MLLWHRRIQSYIFENLNSDLSIWHSILSYWQRMMNFWWNKKKWFNALTLFIVIVDKVQSKIVDRQLGCYVCCIVFSYLNLLCSLNSLRLSLSSIFVFCAYCCFLQRMLTHLAYVGLYCSKPKHETKWFRILFWIL